MYKIVGADGKEYGSITFEQLKQWKAEGRVNARTPVQAAATAEWKTAADFPELGFSPPPGAAGGGAIPSGLAGGQPLGQRAGLALTSFVLGLLSLLCFGLLTGIPAIICGHIAHRRARRSPDQYGGVGFAIAGFIMGYVGFLTTLLLAAMLLPALAQAKGKAQSINCINNMKQIGLAFRIWAIDHEEQFPFNTSTNQGGTLELCVAGPGGFDRNAFLHFQVMSNELSTPRILICAADATKQAAGNFLILQPANISYELYSGTNLTANSPQSVLAVCPIHGHKLLCDGSVQQTRKRGR